MSLISINNWAGELGNNLEQIVNAYWVAQSTNGQFSCNVDHHILDVPKITKFGNNLEPVRHGTANVVFLKKKIDTNNERFKHYHTILQKLSPTLFKKIPKKSFDGLVVHVRAGNIYRDPSCGRFMMQAPLAYFAKAMSTLGIKRDVLVLTKSRHKRDVKRYHNPITNEIIKYCKKIDVKCHVQDDDLESAIGHLLNAKHAMLTGYTTFSRMLLLANPNLESIIIPVMDYWPHDEISFKLHKCAVYHFDIENYPNRWSIGCAKKQITHPAGKIKYRCYE